MGVLDRDRDRRRKGVSFGVNVGHPIITNGDFVHSYSPPVRPSVRPSVCPESVLRQNG